MGKLKKCCCSVCWLTSVTSCSYFIAVFLIAVALVVQLLLPVVLEEQITETVVLEDDNPTLQQLQNPSVPLFKDIYFFNLTNPEETENGAKPVLQEVGPYSYREVRAKTILNTSDDGDLLTYNQTRQFFFNQDTTGEGLRENDTICIINVPLVAAAATVEQLPSIAVGIAALVLRGIFRRTDANLYVCQPATPLAWNYTDRLIVELNQSRELGLIGANYPRQVVNLQVNNSVLDSFPSTIHTGVKDIDIIGTFEQWKGNVGSLNIWPNGMGANDINGTEGIVFSPLLNESSNLTVFSDDAFRSFNLVRTDTVELMGLTAFKYGIDNATFESAFTNADNVRWGSFNPDGLINLGPTQDPPVPIFGSKPHFLDGSPELREKVKGLAPNRSRHDTSLFVEPLTGANVQFSIRLQVNVQVNQSSRFRQLNDINGTVYFPLFYIDERSVMTEEFTDFLLDNGLRLAYLVMDGSPVIFIVFLVVAGILLLLGTATLLTCIKIICAPKKRYWTTSRRSERRQATNAHQLLPNPVSVESPERREPLNITEIRPSAPPLAVHIHLHSPENEKIAFLQKDESNQMQTEYNLYPQIEAYAV